MDGSRRWSIAGAARLARIGARAVVDTAFPPRCPGCHRRGSWLCLECQVITPYVEVPRCLRCGYPSEGACRCHELPDALDRLRAALWYEAWVPTAIQWFKYEGEFARATALSGFLETELCAFDGIDALVPVPLHPRRQQRRGYNQSRELAVALHPRAGVPVEEPLVRVRNTPRQVGLHGSERAINVAGAVALKPAHDVRGRKLLLLDDVVTTGATLGECARVLRAGGAAWVGGLAIARER